MTGGDASNLLNIPFTVKHKITIDISCRIRSICSWSEILSVLPPMSNPNYCYRHLVSNKTKVISQEYFGTKLLSLVEGFFSGLYENETVTFQYPAEVSTKFSMRRSNLWEGVVIWGSKIWSAHRMSKFFMRRSDSRESYVNRLLFTTCQQSWGKVIFSVVSVCSQGGFPCDHYPWCHWSVTGHVESPTALTIQGSIYPSSHRHVN